MPRSSSRGSSRSSSSFARAPAPAARAPPPPARQAPPPAPTPAPAAPAAAAPAPSGGMLSGLGSTIMQGMAFGTGSAIAHQAVGAVARSFSGSGSSEAPAPTPQQTQPAAPVSNAANGPCSVDLAAFNRCMKENDNNVTACDFYYNALQQCQASSHY